MKESLAKPEQQPIQKPVELQAVAAAAAAVASPPVSSFNSANSIRSYERSMLKYRFN